jgi:hypothetical protein
MCNKEHNQLQLWELSSAQAATAITFCEYLNNYRNKIMHAKYLVQC